MGTLSLLALTVLPGTSYLVPAYLQHLAAYLFAWTALISAAMVMVAIWLLRLDPVADQLTYVLVCIRHRDMICEASKGALRMIATIPSVRRALERLYGLNTPKKNWLFHR